LPWAWKSAPSRLSGTTAKTQDSSESGSTAMPPPGRGARLSSSAQTTPVSLSTTRVGPRCGRTIPLRSHWFLEGARRDSCWFLCDPLDCALVRALTVQLPELFPRRVRVHPPPWHSLPGQDPRFALLLVQPAQGLVGLCRAPRGQTQPAAGIPRAMSRQRAHRTGAALEVANGPGERDLGTTGPNTRTLTCGEDTK